MHSKQPSVRNIILSFFKRNPTKWYTYEDLEKTAYKECEKIKGRKIKDPNTQVRDASREGYLLKKKVGQVAYYKLNPNPNIKTPSHFSEKVKKEILKRDNYSCVYCGMGINNGVKIEIDHIVSKQKGGSNTIDNGQVLCEAHNQMKKNKTQFEALHKLLFKINKNAIKNKNSKIIDFTKYLLDGWTIYNIENSFKMQGD